MSFMSATAVCRPRPRGCFQSPRCPPSFWRGSAFLEILSASSCFPGCLSTWFWLYGFVLFSLVAHQLQRSLERFDRDELPEECQSYLSTAQRSDPRVPVPGMLSTCSPAAGALLSLILWFWFGVVVLGGFLLVFCLLVGWLVGFLLVVCFWVFFFLLLQIYRRTFSKFPVSLL